MLVVLSAVSFDGIQSRFDFASCPIMESDQESIRLQALKTICPLGYAFRGFRRTGEEGHDGAHRGVKGLACISALTLYRFEVCILFNTMLMWRTAVGF